MDRLDLRLVEYFVAVAEELHFGRAATRLHISQPSLSQQIRRLETQLGAPLLTRSSRRVELTSAGSVLLIEGRRTLAQARRTLRAVREADTQRVRVGFYGSVTSALLTDVLRDFTRAHPAIDVTVRELELSQISELLDGNLDVAFTRMRVDEADAEIEVLLEEPRVVAVPADHRLAARESIALSELNEDAFITGPREHNPAWRRQWIAEQRRHGLPGRIAAEASSVQEILTLVAAGRGICLVPQTAAQIYQRPDVAYVTVRDADPATISVAWTGGPLAPAVAAFIATAREVARAQAG
jgi:DNA-binding transcriptional LysR family regulator